MFLRWLQSLVVSRLPEKLNERMCWSEVMVGTILPSSQHKPSFVFLTGAAPGASHSSKKLCKVFISRCVGKKKNLRKGEKK